MILLLFRFTSIQKIVTGQNVRSSPGDSLGCSRVLNDLTGTSSETKHLHTIKDVRNSKQIHKRDMAILLNIIKPQPKDITYS
jgi:hypothetical protein